MRNFDIAQYNAFSDTLFGGSPAALVNCGAAMSDEEMQQIAQEFGIPATAFIQSSRDDRVDVRFFSTRTEYPMCGHASIALMTWLHERGELTIDGDSRSIVLGTPASDAECFLTKQNDGRLQVMLSLAPATFVEFDITASALAPLLGVTDLRLHPDLPIAFTRVDFSHLFVALADLGAVQSIVPDFDAIARFCVDHGIDTLVVFSMETLAQENTVHVREFCPAVGTPEAPAAGTTNRALACYLFQHGQVQAPTDSSTVEVITEQGFCMGRPSRIVTQLDLTGGKPQRVRVGGVATRFYEGTLALD